MKIDYDVELDWDDVLMQQQRSNLDSRSQINVEREFFFYHSPRKWVGVPIIASNMSCLAGFDLALALAKHKMITCLHKFIPTLDLVNFFAEHKDKIDYIWVSIGKNDGEILKLFQISRGMELQPNICIDVPNGGLESFTKYCKSIRNKFPESIIMAGNVTNPACVQELILQGGVDIVKLFIGPGSQCTTRLVTGVGRPSFSCSVECSHAAHGLKSDERRLGLVCGDGGFKKTGDICKGFGAGLDFCMTGSLFFGVEESCGEWEYKPFSGKKYWYCEKDSVITTSPPYRTTWLEGLELTCNKSMTGVLLEPQYSDYMDVVTHNKELNGIVIKEPTKKRLKVFGMSSKEAQEANYGEYKPYRASEGRSGYVDYKGPVDGVVQEILGGIRSSSMYIGSNSLKDMSKCAEFKRVTKIHHRTD